MSRVLIVIPARMGSTRFPGKVLASLGGRPVVSWCAAAARAARVGPVVVATDSRETARVLACPEIEVALTSARCASGTDRVWKVVRQQRWRAYRFVVNLQGDEPLIRPSTIRRVAALLRRPGVDIATAVVPTADPSEARNPNVVKAVLAKDGSCLYFSRSPVPFVRSDSGNGTAPIFYKHIGIYGFRREALKRFASISPSPLERREGLEQLRALEAGMTIAAAVVFDRTVAIDVPSDMTKARAIAGLGDKHHG